MLKEKWGKLTDDDLDVIDGRRQQLVGKMQERYGMAMEEAEHCLTRRTPLKPSAHDVPDAAHSREYPVSTGTGRNALTGISPSILSLRYRKSPLQ